ncbi:MAG: YHS domain-containing (seleno)protein [Candidatus Competibacterales bacterium]
MNASVPNPSLQPAAFTSASAAIRSGIALALLIAAAVAFAPKAWALDPVYQSGWFEKVAIKGYDPVAYFTDNKPVEGSDDFEATWNGATWRFASAENRDRFQADPEAYAPQYGGYCAYAVANNTTAPIDPAAFKIVDDKLYLNYNASIQAKWEQDIPSYIQRADQHWPAILAR